MTTPITVAVKPVGTAATVSNGVEPDDTVPAGTTGTYDDVAMFPLQVSGLMGKVTGFATAGGPGIYGNTTLIAAGTSHAFDLSLGSVTFRTAAGAGSGGGNGGKPTEPPVKH